MAEDFYVKTGQTGAQTQIDVAHTSSFSFQPTTATSFAGGIFTMKAGSSASRTVTFALYENLSAGPVRSVTLTYSQFCALHTPASNCSQFGPVQFSFATPYVMVPGRTYYARLTSGAPDVQSQAYFIKGADGCLLANAGGTTTSTAQCNYIAPSTTQPSLTMAKSVSSTTVTAGEPFTYTLTVTNTGTGAATTASVADQLPAGITFIQATGPGWICSDAAQLITCNFSGLIAVNRTSTITVTAEATAAAVGQSPVNWASVDPTGGDLPVIPSEENCATAGTNVCDSATISVVRAGTPDLSVEKSAPSPDLELSVNSIYTITVRNDGGAAATTATVYDTLPAGLTFVSATNNTDWTCGGSGSLVTCTLNAGRSIAPDGSLGIEITVTPTAAGTFVNTALADREGGTIDDVDEACDSETVSCSTNTSVAGAVGLLSIAKGAPSPALQLNRISTYTITVTNVGGAVITPSAGFVEEALPPYLEYLGTTSPDWTCTPSSMANQTTLSCDYGSALVPEATATLVLSVRPADGVAPEVTNYASIDVTGGGSPPEAGPSCTDTTACAENTAEVNLASALSITKSSTTGFVAGKAGTYRLTVANPSAVSGTFTRIRDRVPDGMAILPLTPPTGWDCTVEGQLVDCFTQDASADIEPIDIDVLPDAELSGLDVTNWASIGTGADEDDAEPPEPQGCTAAAICDSLQNIIVAPAGFIIGKSQPVPPLEAGKRSIYTLSITTDDASQIAAEVKDQLPDGMSLVSAVSQTTTNWNCSVDALNLITCTGVITNAQVEQIAIEVEVDQLFGTQTVVNYASVGIDDSEAGGAPDPGPECDVPGLCASSSSMAEDREEIEDAVEEDVRAFMASRLDRLASHLNKASRLQQFRNTECGASYGGALNADGTESSLRADGAVAVSYRGGAGSIVPTADAPQEQCGSINLWSELEFNYVDGKSGAVGQTALATVGAEYLITPSFLAGLRVTFDFTDFDLEGVSEANSRIRGVGWLAGPYFSAEIVRHVYFDAFIGYGNSSNDYEGEYAGIDLDGDFAAQRILATASLTGEFERGDLLFRPSAAVTYGREWSGSFIVTGAASGPTTIDSQAVELGRVSARLETVYRTSVGDGHPLDLLLVPIVSYDFLRSNGEEIEVILGSSDFRAGVEGGFRYAAGSFGAGLLAGYDGIGAPDWAAYRGEFSLNYNW